jgi:GT2 family glycosyltransferase
MARPALKILVSVINWNNPAATDGCLAGIAAMPPARQPDVIVVDNGSADAYQIKSAVEKSLKSVRLVANEHNLGFAGGHNPNIKFAKEQGYDYIVLLNNDSEIVDAGIFDKLSETLEQEPRALGANPAILSRIKPEIIWYGGGKLSLITGRAMHQLVGEPAKRLPAATEKVSLLTGGCLAIALRRAELKTLYLPENYFVYWEDTEWCTKAARAGYELLFVPQAKLLHYVSSSLGVRSSAYIYYNIRNNLIFIRRNLAAVYRALGWARVVYISLKYAARIMLSNPRKLSSLKAIWLGWLHGMKGRGGQLRKSL